MDFIIDVIALAVLVVTLANVLHWAWVRRTCHHGGFGLFPGKSLWVIAIGGSVWGVLGGLALAGFMSSVVGGVIGLVSGILAHLVAMRSRCVLLASTA